MDFTAIKVICENEREDDAIRILLSVILTKKAKLEKEIEETIACLKAINKSMEALCDLK